MYRSTEELDLYSDVASEAELSSTKNDAENKGKRDKLNAVLVQMDKINEKTAKMIEKIDKIKLRYHGKIWRKRKRHQS